MKEQILEIAEKLRLELITNDQAQDLLFGLYGVRWRSEQLKAFFSEMIEEFDSGRVSLKTRDSAERILKSL